MEIIPRARNYLNYKYRHQYYISIYQQPGFNKCVMYLVDYVLYIFEHKYDQEALSPCFVKLSFAVMLQRIGRYSNSEIRYMYMRTPSFIDWCTQNKGTANSTMFPSLCVVCIKDNRNFSVMYASCIPLSDRVT